MIWDWSFAAAILPELLRATLVTLQATLYASLTALIFGFVLALLRRSGIRLIRWPTAAFIEVVRSTPLLLQLYFIFFVLPQYGLSLSPILAGTLGLGIHYATYISEVYRAGIEDVPTGQWEAAKVLNLTMPRTWSSIIVPQVITRIVPSLGNYVVQMFKATAILEAITLVELLGEANVIGAQSFRYLEPFTLVGLIFLALSYPAALGLRYLERKLHVRH
ncbi:ectoine/hydroxyectoine ABC transporter permease subunit EhuD [Saccharomonospora sp. NPDC046836]|uniref:ectoine/hydroxyectoine ABC transporter permease subunit EhuD n=1 Tax=Saccharomonospora sp. NPDC046836 TaxID=3156921 RepID=UPI00340363BA